MKRCKQCGCFIGGAEHKCPKQWLSGKKVDRKKYPKMGHFEKHSLESKKKMSQSHIGNTAHLGKKHTEETKQRMSQSHKRNPTRYWLGRKRPDISRMMKRLNTGRKWSREIVEKRTRHGKDHWSWQGGKSFEPYDIRFNNALRERVRKRDNSTCQECGYTQELLGYRLCVHHIDYNKKNNKLENLVSLCRACHCQTNFKRTDWTNYFSERS